MMPNPGYDTITVHPVFGFASENNSSITQQNAISIIMTNGTIIVNTTNMDPQCNIECYTSCRILFPEFIEQKYCIISMCKCQVIEKEVNLPENNYKNNSHSLDVMASEMHKYSTTAFIGIDKNNKNLDINNQFKNEKSNFYWIFYALIFVVSLGYEYFIFDYLSKINNFSLYEWLNAKNDSKFKKYRINNDNLYLESNNNELRQCLL